jgi:hypothetical protein
MQLIDPIILQLRNERNQLLFQTDKYVLADYPISPENLEKMKIYRQQLRDFFQTDEVKNYNITLSLPKKPDF